MGNICLFVDNITQFFLTGYDGILCRGPGWYNKELINFW